jgi:hypothetical protein
MILALLHGEILIGWFLTGALATFAAVAVFLWWFWHPPRSPIVPAGIYLLLAIVAFVLWKSDESNLLTSSLGFALTLPWSAIVLLAVMIFDIQVSTWAILPGIPLNVVLIYFAAKAMRRRRPHPINAG